MLPAALNKLHMRQWRKQQPQTQRWHQHQAAELMAGAHRKVHVEEVQGVLRLSWLPSRPQAGDWQQAQFDVVDCMATKISCPLGRVRHTRTWSSSHVGTCLHAANSAAVSGKGAAAVHVIAQAPRRQLTAERKLCDIMEQQHGVGHGWVRGQPLAWLAA